MLQAVIFDTVILHATRFDVVILHALILDPIRFDATVRLALLETRTLLEYVAMP